MKKKHRHCGQIIDTAAFQTDRPNYLGYAYKDYPMCHLSVIRYHKKFFTYLTMIFIFDARNSRICKKLKSNGYPIKRAIFELPDGLFQPIWQHFSTLSGSGLKKDSFDFHVYFPIPCTVPCGHKKTFLVFADIINKSWIAFICKQSNFGHRLLKVS